MYYSQNLVCFFPIGWCEDHLLSLTCSLYWNEVGSWRYSHVFYLFVLYIVLGDNGSLWFWDWKSGHNFQQAQTIVQPGTVSPLFFSIRFSCVWNGKEVYAESYFSPGSLDSEAGIYAVCYDVSGSRLVTCEADKTIKMWKEDEDATPETHPLNYKPPKDIRRF